MKHVEPKPDSDSESLAKENTIVILSGDLKVKEINTSGNMNTATLYLSNVSALIVKNSILTSTKDTKKVAEELTDIISEENEILALLTLSSESDLLQKVFRVNNVKAIKKNGKSVLKMTITSNGSLAQGDGAKDAVVLSDLSKKDGKGATITMVSGIAKPTILDLATTNPDFSTLEAAVKAADLAEALSGPGPFTVFAPTNAAFDKLPTGKLNNLLKPKNKSKLQNLLKYHVVSGEFNAAELIKTKNKKLTTLNGQDLKVKVKNGDVYINNAQVTTGDVEASNGVIHVIDTVLLPPA
jgi:uncharacterized surface protein with fasciclin (FAS1) repeats